MNSGSKIHISEQDIKCFEDKTFFIQKKRLTDYILIEYGEVADYFQKEIYPTFNFLVKGEKNEPKTYRGENLNNTPYFVLDLPRIQDSNHIFLIRMHLWWGNFFSITLVLTGDYIPLMKDSMIENFRKIGFENFKNSLWNFDYNQSDDLINYEKDASHIKLYKTFPLSQLNHLQSIGVEELNKINKILLLK